jgi:hypothetical protein
VSFVWKESLLDLQNRVFCLEADPAIFELTVRALAEGNSLYSTARIVQIDKDTVCAWLNRAAHPCRLVMLYHWQNLPVSECQVVAFVVGKRTQAHANLLLNRVV